MLSVKRERRLIGDIDFADESSFFKDAALIIAQDLGDAAKFINETGDTGVGGTDHGATIFHATEDGVGQVLT